MSKAALTQARVRIVHDTEALRGQPLDQLRVLAKTPKKENLEIQRKRIEITTWAREHDHDRLAVIVEARARRFWGWQVIADGFYKASDGASAEFQEKDYWEHGY